MSKILSIDHTCCSVKFNFNENCKINIKISEETNCCEVFGIYIIRDNISMNDMEEYISKELTNIDLVFNEGNSNFEIVGKKINETNKQISFNLNNKNMSENPIFRLYFGENEHPLDIMLYNEHNGYYSHDCYIEIDLVMNGYSLKHESLYSI